MLTASAEQMQLAHDLSPKQPVQPEQLSVFLVPLHLLPRLFSFSESWLLLQEENASRRKVLCYHALLQDQNHGQIFLALSQHFPRHHEHLLFLVHPSP